jgi:hypothetical protein
MSLRERIFYYSIGLILGIIALKYIWKQKNTQFTYFPSDRIVNDIASKDLEVSPLAECQARCFNLSKAMIEELLENKDFEGSVVDREAKPCKKYKLEAELQDIEVNFFFDNCDSTAVLTNISSEEKSCDCK